MNTAITVSQLAQRRPYLTVHLNTRVSQVIETMAKRKVTAVCVTRRDKLVGIFTMKDVMTRVLGYKANSVWRVPKRRPMRDVPVRLLMSPDVYSIDSEAGVMTAFKLMKKHKIRHLPVLKEGNLIGVITIKDVLDALKPAERRKSRQRLGAIYREEPGAVLARVKV